MDWLCRFNFRLVAYHSPRHNYVTLNGLRFKLSYSDCPSLAIKVLAVRHMPNMAVDSVNGATPVFCPPNAGMFVPGIVWNEEYWAVAMVTGCPHRFWFRAV